MGEVLGAAFDLEGTVVDLELAHYRAFFKIAQILELQRFTEDPMSFEERIPGSIGSGENPNIRALLELAGEETDDDMIETFKLMKVHFYKQALNDMDVVPRPGSRAVIHMIKGLGLPVSICSLTPADQATIIFGRSGVNTWFEPNRIVLREDVMRRKPYPDAYVMSAIKNGVPPKRQLVFEDSVTGIQAAIAASKVLLDPMDPMNQESRVVTENPEPLVIAMPSETVQRSPVYPDYKARLFEAGAMAVFESWEDLDLITLVMELIG